MNIDNTEYLLHTKQEIEGQPKLWEETLKLLRSNKGLQEFYSSLASDKKINIVLTGAGTSAFIGEITEHLFVQNQNMNFTSRAISTTTLVTHFTSYISTSEPLLLISFARSGNSPESIAAVDLAETHCEDLFHMAITCNPEGELAKKMNNLKNGLSIILPPDSEDKGLAMTGSFTSMVLTSIYLAHELGGRNGYDKLDPVVSAAGKAIETYSPVLKELASKEFDRIVFLGSGPLFGMAKESHLKVQELTDGHVVGKFDSFLGFRHGPKAVVNERTVLVFLFSRDEKVFRYEKDLVEEILQDGIAMHCVGVFCSREQAEQLNVDDKIIFDSEDPCRDYELMLYVLPAQLLGYYKSLDLGLNPDSPSQNNVISRVVKGVTIYPS